MSECVCEREIERKWDWKKVRERESKSMRESERECIFIFAIMVFFNLGNLKIQIIRWERCREMSECVWERARERKCEREIDRERERENIYYY